MRDKDTGSKKSRKKRVRTGSVVDVVSCRTSVASFDSRTGRSNPPSRNHSGSGMQLDRMNINLTTDSPETGVISPLYPRYVVILGAF